MENDHMTQMAKDLHTMKYRLDALESEKLPHRVTTLESAVKEISSSMGRVEVSVNDMKKELSKNKLWMAALIGAAMSGPSLLDYLKGIVL